MVVVVLLCENSLVLVKYKGKQHWKKIQTDMTYPSIHHILLVLLLF